MSWLSPVSWAKWTWTAVRGGEGEEDEEGLEATEEREECGERGEEEEERSQGCSSDSEGHFDTPEAATPVRAPPTFPGELENNNADPDKTDVDTEEQLIVTAPVGDQDILRSLNMGQDDPATPMGGPVQVNIQTIEEEQTETFSEAQGPAPVPAPSPVKEMLECTVPELQEPDPVLPPEPVLDVSPAPAPAPAPALTPPPEPESVPIIEHVADPAVEPTEQKPVAEPELEPECTGLIQDVPTQKTKTRKSKPPSLKVKASQEDITQTNGEEEPELPVPMATYKFDPDQLDDSFNPFTCGGSKLQNSPPPCGTSMQPRLEPLGASLPDCEASVPPPVETDMMESSTKAKPVVLEFGLDEGKVSKPPPRKLGGKKTLKLTAKKQKPKGSEASPKPAPEPTETETDSQPLSETDSQPVSEPVPQPASEPVSDPLPEQALPVSDSTAPVNLDDIPIPKAGSYNFDPSQWDDPNFNPFGNNSKVSSSPVLPRGSYKFDPDNFDDSIDPFKSSKTLSTEDSADGAPQPEKEKVKVGGKQKTGLPAGEKKVRQIPKKSKESTITNSCKAQKYDESQALGNDACSQEDEVVVQTPEITQQVQHATDEEKLASTAIIGQTSDSLEEKESECTKLPAKIQSIKSAFSVNAPETKPVERDTCSLKDDIVPQTPTMITNEAPIIAAFSQDSLDNPETEMDKAAVLTMIREEIINKEIEVNEWKRKYEESRAEVLAMREIVAEYEKTVAQMIEDEQQQKMLSSTKTVKQLAAERDLAIADLDSMERSFADLFRRYEHMKGVLEDFKKNEEVLKKCAQDYLMRIKQEEQRYQNLKAHAEEKLDKANEKIAHIRSEANAEGVALNARLRKEQMKVESLERAVVQKNEEIEELSKICDELIAKLGTK